MFFFNLEGSHIPFGERLRAAREKANYTAKEFAVALDIKYETYIGYETRGREPKYDTLIKICDRLQITTDELLGVSRQQEALEDDIEKPLAHLQEMLQQPTANFRGKDFDHRGRLELAARVNELAQRAEVLSEFEDLGPLEDEKEPL